MRVVVLTLALLLSFAVHGADGPQKPPWRWTTEERLALRLDPQSIQARAAHDDRLNDSPRRNGDAPRFVIDGARDPQLFLPWELFENLTGSLREDSLRDRQRLSTAITKFGWKDAEFWPTLATLTAAYRTRHAGLLNLMQAMQEMPPAERRDAEARLESENIALCGLRADALVQARAHFGEEAFQRFLYEAVAPQILISSGGRADEGERRRLLYVEGGCR
jgi:hypothetical protein